MKKQEEKKPDQYLLAFDPGGTTGMALIRYNEKEVSLSVLAQIEDGHMGFYDNLVGVPGGWGTNTTVISEKWVEHGVKGADRTPLVIEGIQYAFWPDQVIYQTPDMKQMVTDDDLKELGVWTPGKPHQMDALRHALIWLRNQMHEPTLQMLGNGQPMQKDGEQAEGVETGRIDAEAEEAQEGQGQGQPKAGDSDDGEGQGQSRQVQDGKPLGPGITFLMEGDQADLSLVEKVQHVYDRERDLDGAFSGYQADPTAERRTLIEEDF